MKLNTTKTTAAALVTLFILLALIDLVSAIPSTSSHFPFIRSSHRDITLRRRSTSRKCPTRKTSGAVSVSSGTSPSPSPQGQQQQPKQPEKQQPPAQSWSGCFPSRSFKMPYSVPSGESDLSQWWCNPNHEYAFLGFSYLVTPCQSRSQLTAEFKDIRNRFNGRYVRLYGGCDSPGFYNDVVEAAWSAGVGVHALIWFGFEGGSAWMGRRDALVHTIKTNPKAKFVTRVVQFGSEPLFDSVLSPDQLAHEVTDLKKKLKHYGIAVTISDLVVGWSKPGAQAVVDAVDVFDGHELPFFSGSASTGGAAWPLIQNDIQWYMQRANGRKLYLTENGWPSTESQGITPNNAGAVASVSSARGYFDMLDAHCADFKKFPGGGVGWFAHLYAEYAGAQGYGVVLDQSGTLKFPFSPRTSC